MNMDLRIIRLFIKIIIKFLNGFFAFLFLRLIRVCSRYIYFVFNGIS